MTIIDQSIQNKIVMIEFIIKLVLIATIILCFITWILYKYHMIHMMQLKEFSMDLYTSFGGTLQDRSVFVDRKISSFNSYTTIDKPVLLKDHRDFKWIKDKPKFRNTIRSIENLPIPSKAYFGYAAVLTRFYENFRCLWNDMNFNQNSLLFSFGIPLNNVNRVHQMHYYKIYRQIFENNENVSTLDVEKLYSCMYFLQMYLSHFS